MSEDEHRCFRMLNDYWEPKGSGAIRYRDDPDSFMPAKIKPGSVSHPSLLSRFASLPMLIVYAFAILLVASGSAVVLSTQTTRATNDQKIVKPMLMATAKMDFFIRDDAHTESLKKQLITTGTQMELVDSRAGETLSNSAENPAKWYKVRIVGNNEVGWAHSGWIDRKQ